MPSSCAEARPVPHCHELVGLISSCSDFKDMQTTQYDGWRSLKSHRAAADQTYDSNNTSEKHANSNIHSLVKLTCDRQGCRRWLTLETQYRWGRGGLGLVCSSQGLIFCSFFPQARIARRAATATFPRGSAASSSDAPGASQRR